MMCSYVFLNDDVAYVECWWMLLNGRVFWSPSGYRHPQHPQPRAMISCHDTAPNYSGFQAGRPTWSPPKAEKSHAWAIYTLRGKSSALILLLAICLHFTTWQMQKKCEEWPPADLRFSGMLWRKSQPIRPIHLSHWAPPWCLGASA